MKLSINASILLCILLMAAGLYAQPTAAARDTFTVGTQRVVIPPPAGFINGYERIPAITARFKGDDPDSLTLAVHVPTGVALILNAGKPVEWLDFYTNVYLPKSMTGVEVTPPMFAEFAAGMEKNAGAALDINNPETMAMIKRSLEAIEKRTGRPPDMDLKQTKFLGTVQKDANVLSLLVMADIESSDGIRRLIATTSGVVVNSRLIYISVYKRFTNEKDIADLQNFTKTWTAAILAANTKAGPAVKP